MEQRLEFENSRFLLDLLGNDLSCLEKIEAQLGLEVISRDAWIKLIGSAEAIAAARELFVELEKLVRGGVEVSSHTFDLLLQQSASKGNESQDRTLAEQLKSQRLLNLGGRPGIAPRTKNQLRFVEALRRSELVFGMGPAGTGKTFLAMAHGLHLLLENGVERIILTRPAVEAGEELGFLPGDLNEKILPYLRPLYDAMHDLLGAGQSGKLVDKNLIEVAPLAYMRGRTLKNAIVVLDEAQNTTKEQMFMLLTRLGEGSRMIVTGDPGQIDLRPQRNSGLLEARRHLSGVDGIELIEFGAEDVVRNPLVQKVVKAYARGRKHEEEQK